MRNSATRTSDDGLDHATPYLPTIIVLPILIIALLSSVEVDNSTCHSLHSGKEKTSQPYSLAGILNGCSLPPEYFVVPNEGKKLLDRTRDLLVPAAELPSRKLHNAIIRRRDGASIHIAMTCGQEGNIWFSEGMMELLKQVPLGIEWVYSHEIGHSWNEYPTRPYNDSGLYTAELGIYDRLNHDQLMEVAADQRGINILWNASLPIKMVPATIGDIARRQNTAATSPSR
jgi:hypothetical protein